MNTKNKVQSLTLFFPCFNEQPHVARMVRRCLAIGRELAEQFEVIVVDDGSTDGSAEIAEALTREVEQVRLVRHARNRGYGQALQSGFRAARHELIFYTDGDGQFDVAELRRILPLIQGCDVVSCYRRRRRDPLLRKLNAGLFERALGLVFGLRIRDVDCAFKLYRKQVIDAIQMVSTGALIDAEMLLRARRAGFRVRQAPVSHYARLAGQQTGANPRVILRAMWELVHLRWLLRQRWGRAAAHC